MTYLHTEFRMSNFRGTIVIVIELKAKCRF
jgi:hypothetical protein